MIQVNFYSQSEATLLSTKPRLILYLVFTCETTSNTQSKFSFYSQSEATLLTTKSPLIFDLATHVRNHASNTQSKLSFSLTKCGTPLNTRPRYIFYLVHVIHMKNQASRLIAAELSGYSGASCLTFDRTLFVSESVP